MTRKDVLNKLRDMGIAPINRSVLSDFTEIANWSAAAERERCAKVVEDNYKGVAAACCADQIRGLK